MSLQELQYNGNEESLKARLVTVVDGVVRIFRQAIANGGMKAGPLTLKNEDLNRVHTVVNEIDTRRVFYTFYEDELPPHCIESVNEARTEIRKAVRGVWAEPSQEVLLQQLQHVLSDFVSATQRIQPLPRWHHDARFDDFVSLMVDLRFRVWSVIAALVIKNGSIIQPAHLPPEGLAAVKKANLR